MDDDYTNYTIRLQKSKRDEWKREIEDIEQFSTVSQLIRYSVDQQVQRIKDQEEDGMTKEEKDILNKIEAEHGLLRNVLDDIQEALSRVEETGLTTSEAENMTHQQTQHIISEYQEEHNDE